MRAFFHKDVHAALYIASAIVLCTSLTPAYATPVINGAADIGRIATEPPAQPPDRSHDKEAAVPNHMPAVEIPKGAESIRFVLRRVNIEGVTAFDKQTLGELYAKDLNKEVNLGIAWKIAAALTERYRSAGYLLSRAYVPQQEVDNGTITVKVVEGYVGKVEINGPVGDQSVVKQMIAHLLSQKPVKADQIESFLLRMNDLPGVTFRK